MLGTMKRQYFTPYHVEGWNIVIDINNMSVFGLPVKVFWIYLCVTRFFRVWKRLLARCKITLHVRCINYIFLTRVLLCIWFGESPKVSLSLKPNNQNRFYRPRYSDKNKYPEEIRNTEFVRQWNSKRLTTKKVWWINWDP